MDGPELRGFPPVVRTNSRVLILGSMPGVASLQAGRYYAHPRNAFWPMMGDLIGAAPTLPYEKRLEILLDAGLAIWDVMAACQRPGSLDADIRQGSERTNDFSAFFAVHRKIVHVCFNGAFAETCFRRRVLPLLPELPGSMTRLPSTSPAHAAKSYGEKRAAWQEILTLLK